jgi:hypothetical protein
MRWRSDASHSLSPAGCGLGWGGSNLSAAAPSPDLLASLASRPLPTPEVGCFRLRSLSIAELGNTRVRRGEVKKEIRSRDAFRARVLRITTPQRQSSFRFAPGTHDPEKWCPAFGQDHAHEKGRRSAERRKFIGAAPHRQTLPFAGAPQTSVRSLRHLSAYAAAGLSEPARLPALRGGSCRSDRTLRLSPGRASRDEVRGRYLRLWIALKRGTPRAGRTAGGNDARTARERGYKPRPQQPHSPHPTAVTGRRP